MAPEVVAADSHAQESETLCVFTSLFGQYDTLLEQPVAQYSDARFVCFTDDPELTSDTWEIHVVEPAFAADSVRSARLHKILGPHVDFDFDVSVYIDASVRLRETPEVLVGEWLSEGVDMALPLHSYREHLVDEFDEVIRLNYDDRARVYEQLADYAENSPHVLSARPHWTAILVRRNSAAIARAMRVWADHVLRYSRRDQLSIMLALDTGLAFRGIDIDNFDSRFHEWPVIVGRRVANGKAPQVPIGPMIADLQRARRRITGLEEQLRDLRPERLADLGAEIADLKAQIDQGYHERLRLEQQLDNKTREAVLASERARQLEARQGRARRLREKVARVTRRGGV